MALFNMRCKMKSKTRKCIVCGKEYEYCNNCRNNIAYPTWMAIYHDENCRNIMNIATEYMAGNLTKAEAATKLNQCDLSKEKNFKASVRNALNSIFDNKKNSKNVKVAEIENVEN